MAGLAVLTVRRWGLVRVRLVTTRIDLVAFLALWVMVLLGFGETVIHNLLGSGYNYRPTISVWLRGIFSFIPTRQRSPRRLRSTGSTPSWASPFLRSFRSRGSCTSGAHRCGT